MRNDVSNEAVLLFPTTAAGWDMSWTQMESVWEGVSEDISEEGKNDRDGTSDRAGQEEHPDLDFGYA